MAEVQNNNAGKSFAERYAKKPSFTSESMVQKSAAEPQQNAGNAAQTGMAAAAQKAIDPMKRMQADLIYLVKGIDAGRNAWYYVLVDRLKLQLFLKALNDDIIHLENYGKILYSAYGDEPPADVTNKLKGEYGIK